MSTPIVGTTYPFDPTGQLASNLIPSEQQILTAQNYQDYHLLVPVFAPYFVDSLVVTYKDTDGNVKILTEGVDYICTHVFHDASLACATPIAGSISFYNTLLTGVAQLKYQTLGGIWTIDTATITQILADRLHNPRITTWEQVTEQPVTFPVIDHEWNLVDLVGMSDVVTSLNDITNMLAQTGSTGLAVHEADHDNPHLVTATQVGLGLVQNFAIASTTDAQTGVRNDLYMTPAATAAAISVLPSGGLATHEADHTNPHQVTATQVGLGNVPNYGAASTADAQAATRDDVFMTPLKTAALLSAGFGQDLANHEDDYTNPHRVTAQEVGSYTTAETDQLLAAKLDATAQAVDSAKLAGQTLQQIEDLMVTLKVNNATNADHASDSDTLGSLTAQEIIAAAQSSSGSFASQMALTQSISQNANLWTRVGSARPANSAQNNTMYPDAQIIVSGGDGVSDNVSGLYLITLSSGRNGQTPAMTVLNLTGGVNNCEFGWAAGVDSQSNPTLDIWVKTSGNANFIASTELSPNGTFLSNAVAPVATEPTGITYVVEDSFARASDVANGLQTMATAFENFKASVLTA